MINIGLSQLPTSVLKQSKNYYLFIFGQIYNQTGIPIGQHRKIAQGMNRFDFSDIPSGMYFISISKDGKRLGQQQRVKH